MVHPSRDDTQEETLFTMQVCPKNYMQLSLPSWLCLVHYLMSSWEESIVIPLKYINPVQWAGILLRRREDRFEKVLAEDNGPELELE